MINGIEHMTRLVGFGVYFGYSTESIVEFIINFGTAYDEYHDYRTIGETDGTGHMCSSYEAITYNKDELIQQINSRRYCGNKFPDLEMKVQEQSIELEFLMETNFAFNKKVHKLCEHIITTYDIGFEEE